MAISIDITEEVEIPEGVSVTVEDNKVTVQGPNGTLSKEFANPKIKIRKKEKSIEIWCPFPAKREKAMIGTIRAHINNMIKGVTEGFEYKLRVVYSHFPITVKQEGSRIVIDNFLGEKSPRYAKICENVSVEIKGRDIVLRGIDKEKVGQTASNLEAATKISGRDRRIFQDGIWIVSKAGKEIK